MRYLFRDATYDKWIIQYIKPLGIDSDGDLIANNIGHMRLLSQYIEAREPRMIVIALLGRRIIGCSNEDKKRGPVLQAFQKRHRRFPDETYEWKEAEFVLD